MMKTNIKNPTGTVDIPDITARIKDIDPEISFGRYCRIEAAEVHIGRGATLGDNFHFKGRKLVLASRSHIADNVKINFENFELGYKSSIERNCTFSAIRGQGKSIKIGDYTFIGYDSQIMVPELTIGDYGAVHNHLLLNGYAPCRIGHNCFIGQHSVLNASEKLTIGNNVRLALNGYIWTHVESGELLEGCNFHGRSPVTIEDNVWLTGCNISVSPGVTLANGSIILHGSVVTKSTKPRCCYSGVPARDVTDKLKPYREISLNEKFEMLKEYAEDFYQSHPEYRGRLVFVNKFPDGIDDNEEPVLIIARQGEIKNLGGPVSSFSLETKTYTKKRTELEEAYIRFHLGCRARFIPIG
ncbi:MAG: hypothetical protein JXA92_14020 [candidate division Zixibacteria bacterium]|nr:hypothetical protein [candidate division Zixibacteria bacterium]